jgi:hypothetical protein
VFAHSNVVGHPIDPHPGTPEAILNIFFRDKFLQIEFAPAVHAEATKKALQAV